VQQPDPSQARLNSTWRSRILGALALVACVLLVGRTLGKIPPAWNWDVMGYMGLTLEWESDDPAEVHRQTYAAAQAELPPKVFMAHAHGNPVLEARFRDPAVFSEHIAFYRARVLPTFLMSLMHRAGAPLSRSVWWLALGSFAATGLVMLLWLRRWMPLWLAALASTLLLHAPPLLGSASMATVDAFGTLLICLGAYLLLELRAPRAGAAVLVAAILARPDSVILIGILALVMGCMERREAGSRLPAKFYAIWLGASAAAYLAVGYYARAYGWWPLFQISFNGKVVHPGELATSPDWGLWWSVIQEKWSQLPVDAAARAKNLRAGYWGTPGLTTGSAFVFVYTGFLVLGLALWRRLPNRCKSTRHAALLLALLATYFLRWFLFPQLWDRFFAPLYVLVPLVLFSMAAQALEGLRAELGTSEAVE